MICPYCLGSGYDLYSSSIFPCDSCGGYGEINCCEGEQCQPEETKEEKDKNEK